jgi:hypothetical protein
MMTVIQLVVMLIITMPVTAIEWSIRIALFPINVIILIFMQLTGSRDSINSDAWHSIWKYGAFWNLHQFHISKKVCQYLDPTTQN